MATAEQERFYERERAKVQPASGEQDLFTKQLTTGTLDDREAAARVVARHYPHRVQDIRQRPWFLSAPPPGREEAK